MALSPDDLQALAAEVRRQDQAASGLINLQHPDRGHDTDAKGIIPGSTVEAHYRKLGYVTETELLARKAEDAKLADKMAADKAEEADRRSQEARDLQEAKDVKDAAVDLTMKRGPGRPPNQPTPTSEFAGPEKK